MALALARPPGWSVVEHAEAALGEPLAHLVTDAPAEALARTREAQLAVLLTSLVVWEALRPLAERRRRVRRPLARSGHRAHRVGRARPRRRRALRGPTRRAHAGRGRRAPRPHGRAARRDRSSRPSDACAAAPDACWVANDNAPGQVVIAGTPDGLDAALGPRQGARRAARRRRSTSAARSTRR